MSNDIEKEQYISAFRIWSFYDRERAAILRRYAADYLIGLSRVHHTCDGGWVPEPEAKWRPVIEATENLINEIDNLIPGLQGSSEINKIGE